MSGLLGGLPVTNADDLAVAFWQHVVRSCASHHVCGKSAAISVAIHIAADLAMVSRLRNSMASRWSGLGNTRHQPGEAADTMLLGVLSSHEGPALEPMRCDFGGSSVGCVLNSVAWLALRRSGVVAALS